VFVLKAMAIVFVGLIGLWLLGTALIIALLAVQS
jgi:hypothetical protein